MGIDRGENRGKARTVNAQALGPFWSFHRIASCMSCLIQHSVTTVERENVYGGYQWHSVVIQVVALKMCHISSLQFEQKIVRKKPDYQPLYCYENFNVSRYCAILHIAAHHGVCWLHWGDNEITRTGRNVHMIRAELCILKGGNNFEK